MRIVGLIGVGLLALLGCSSESSNSGAGGTASAQGGGGSTGAAGEKSDGGGPACEGAACVCERGSVDACSAEDVAVTPATVTIGKVTAVIKDQDGHPVAGTEIQLCGTNKCAYETTDDAGLVTFDLAGGPNAELTNPVLKFGNNLDTARFGIQVEAGDTDFGDLVTAKLEGGADLCPGDTVEAGKLSMDLSAEGQGVAVDELLNETPESQQLRAVRITDPTATKSFTEAEGFELLYGMAPVDTIFCPPVPISVPNDLDWAPGTEVEFAVQGLDIEQRFAPYGGWSVFAAGKVSDDGKLVATTDKGLVMSGPLGIRRK